MACADILPMMPVLPNDDNLLVALKEMGFNDITNLSNTEISNIIKRLENNMILMRSETKRLKYEHKQAEERLIENRDKIESNKKRPYLVANVVEILDNECVIKTSYRETVIAQGLIDTKELRPNDLIGVNKDSYVILDKLPVDYDSRVKAMQVIEKPHEDYNDIGGLDDQLKELREAIILPILQPEIFQSIGIQPPKGVLLHGPPGTGKTLLARATANHSNATFLKLAGTQLTQGSTGDGAKIIRDIFALAKEKAPAIIFIDEIDAVGTKRFDTEKHGDREVQRTMIELLNQLDGFSSDMRIKVIAATNRPDVLDPALLRSGRIDRKIECPLPNELARERIIKIHAAKMSYHQDVNFKQLARCCEDFNGAQLKAVAVEAGMIALRRGGKILMHEDFMKGISIVNGKKKSNINYYG